MAQRSSGELNYPEQRSWSTDGYTFTFAANHDSSPVTSQCYVTCSSKDGTATQMGTAYGDVKAWSVEINENVADVYAITERGMTPITLNQPVYLNPVTTGSVWDAGFTHPKMIYEVDGDVYAFSVITGNTVTSLLVSAGPASIKIDNDTYEDMPDHWQTINLYSYSYEGRTGNITTPTIGMSWDWASVSAPQDIAAQYAAVVAVTGTGGGSSVEAKTKLVARFAVDIEDPDDEIDPDDTGDDWDDPEDPDPPTHTLYLEVTGALSGRHNDPIQDRTFSYLPPQNDMEVGYGCGGYGGHGGGGGAGASTIVVYKFGTTKADSKQITTKAQRHGYGSGGGKGGRGGKGCILIYLPNTDS